MVIHLSDETIKDISQDVELGMECYVYKETGEIVKFPEQDKWLGDEEESWKEEIDKVEGNLDSYYRIEKMPSREAFIVMEAFIETVANRQTQQLLVNAIAGRKPFAAFHSIIHQLDAERQDWFIHKQLATEAWVRLQLH